MPKLLRNVLALVLGIVIGSAVNMALITFGPMLIAPSAGVDVKTAEGLRAGMHLFQPQHFVMPFLAHALVTLAGAWAAYVIAASAQLPLAYTVGAVFLCGGIAASFMILAPGPVRRADCEAIAKLMRKLSKHEGTMWGSGIVGFGAYRYQYASGHSGESCQVGFSSRKVDISVYLVAAGPDQGELLARLGKHKMGKTCLRFRSLSDIDLKVLEKRIAGSLTEIQRRYGGIA